MVKADLIASERFDEITRISARAVSTMLGLSLAHVGINSASPAEALQGAELLARLLKMEFKEGASSVFVEKQFEFVKQPSRGAHGHLAIGTNFIHRAIAYLSSQGVAVLEETRNEKNGKLASVYLEKEIGGFAIHLLQL